MLQKKNLQVQPHVVVLSSDISCSSKSVAYACVHSSMFFRATSVMEAVDICLKAAFVFGINYPVAAHSCWSFMQKAVYRLSSRFDLNAIEGTGTSFRPECLLDARQIGLYSPLLNVSLVWMISLVCIST
jgi:hypothetical protein